MLTQAVMGLNCHVSALQKYTEALTLWPGLTGMLPCNNPVLELAFTHLVQQQVVSTRCNIHLGTTFCNECVLCSATGQPSTLSQEKGGLGLSKARQ